MALGDTIRAFREARGWSQAELARRAGLSQPALQRVESGASPNPTIRNVDKIARALEVPIEDLLDRQAARGFEDRISKIERRLDSLERRKAK